MSWFIPAFLTALAVATQDAWIKRCFAHTSAFEMFAFPALYSLPLFLAAAWFVPLPAIGPDFAWAFCVSLPLNAFGFLLHLQAIKVAPLSLTVPYLSLTPAFILVTGVLFLQEIPSGMGVLGVCITCAGGYILNIDPGRWHPTAPLRAVLRSSGARMMLGAALIYSFGAVIGKKAILHSSPMFFSIWFYAVFNPVMLCLLSAAGRIRLAEVLRKPGPGAGAGLLLFAHALCHGWAISLTQAAYMISVKRLSVVIGVLYGRFLFGEGNMRVWFAGTLLMMTGAVTITLSGM